MTTLSTSGIIADEAGWPSVFYIFGGLTMIWIIPWLIIIYNSPEQHPYISEAEKNYILTNLKKKEGDKVCVVFLFIR